MGLNINALAAVFKRVLTEQQFSQPEQLPLPLVTVAEKIEELEALLTVRGRVTLEEALPTATSRFAVVVTFLAVLELWHQGRLDVTREGAVRAGRDSARPALAACAPGRAADAAAEAPAVSEFDPTPIAPEPHRRRGRRSERAGVVAGEQAGE